MPDGVDQRRASNRRSYVRTRAEQKHLRNAIARYPGINCLRKESTPLVGVDGVEICSRVKKAAHGGDIIVNRLVDQLTVDFVVHGSRVPPLPGSRIGGRQGCPQM